MYSFSLGVFISVINVEYLKVSPDICPEPHTWRTTPYSHRTGITWGPSVVRNDCKSAMSVICKVKKSLHKLPSIFYETQWSRDYIRHVRMDMLVIWGCIFSSYSALKYMIILL